MIENWNKIFNMCGEHISKTEVHYSTTINYKINTLLDIMKDYDPFIASYQEFLKIMYYVSLIYG